MTAALSACVEELPDDCIVVDGLLAGLGVGVGDGVDDVFVLVFVFELLLGVFGLDDAAVMLKPADFVTPSQILALLVSFMSEPEVILTEAVPLAIALKLIYATV